MLLRSCGAAVSKFITNGINSENSTFTTIHRSEDLVAVEQIDLGSAKIQSRTKTKNGSEPDPAGAVVCAKPTLSTNFSMFVFSATAAVS